MSGTWDNSNKVDRKTIDEMLRDYFKWCESWDELPEDVQMYLKTLVLRLHFKHLVYDDE